MSSLRATGTRAVAVFGLALLLGGLTSATALALERPRPGELARLQRQGRLAQAIRRAKALGNDRAAASLVSRLTEALTGGAAADPLTEPLPGWPDALRGLKCVPNSGTLKIPAVLIDFTDYPATVTTPQLETLLNGPGDAAQYPIESLRQYYQRASYGALDLPCDVLGVYHAPYTRGTVDASANNAESLLVEEAFQHYAALGHDFSQYDQNGDGAIDYAIVFWTGPAGAWASFWWGHFGVGGTGALIDGVSLGKHSWQWEPTGSSAGVVIHETGHALGLPDYYDYDDAVGPRGGVGSWDPMAANQGDPGALSKIMLGWIVPQVVSSGAQAVTLRPSSRYPDATVVMPDYSPGAPRREFFVVQARDASANDDVWPYDQGATGLQVWHVDAVADPWGGFLFDNSFTAHKLLRLMEADGLEDIENNRGANTGDLYRAGQSFGPATTPSSRPYWGTDSGVAVTGIGVSGEAMTCTLTAGANDLDFTPPVTTPGFEPGWHDHAVTLSYTATDALPTWTRYQLPGWAFWAGADPEHPETIEWSTQGLSTISFYSSDYAGNQEATRHVDVGVDLLAPYASDGGVPAGWRASPVSVTLQADDQWMPYGSGIADIQYREGAGAWTSVSGADATVTVPAVGNDGEHTYTYRAGDVAGNLSAESSFTVGIAATGPVTSARPVGGRKSRPIKLRYRVADELSASATAIRLVVKNSRGGTVKTISVGERAVGAWFSARWTPRARGTYRYRVHARDSAGNPQRSSGSALITVR